MTCFFDQSTLWHGFDLSTLWLRSVRLMTWLRSVHLMTWLRSVCLMTWLRSVRLMTWLRSVRLMTWLRSVRLMTWLLLTHLITCFPSVYLMAPFRSGKQASVTSASGNFFYMSVDPSTKHFSEIYRDMQYSSTVEYNKFQRDDVVYIGGASFETSVHECLEHFP